MKIDIFTDGACSGNPGKGGFGILMRVAEKNYQKSFSAGFRLTTNNRMELMAVVVALTKIKEDGHQIHIYTDSKYVSDAINKNWISGWIKRGWKNVKNVDLWQSLIPLIKQHQPQFHWIKGHAGHTENELVDQLAVKATQNIDLQIDSYFEQQQNGGLL